MKKLIFVLTVLIIILVPSLCFADVAEVICSHDDYTVLGDGRFWFSAETKHNNHEPTEDCVFAVSDYFTGVGLPIFWASNPNNGGGQIKAQIKLALYEFNEDYDKSIEAGPVCYAEFLSQGDCPNNGSFTQQGENCVMINFQSGAMIVFDEPMKPGKYIFRVEETNPESGFRYIVLPMANDSNYDQDMFLYYAYGLLDTEHTLSISVKFLTEGEFVPITDDVDMTVVTSEPDFEEPVQDNYDNSNGEKTVQPSGKGNMLLIIAAVCAVLATGFFVYVLFFVKKGRKG